MSKFKTTTIVLSLIAIASLSFADTPKVDARGNSLVAGETGGMPNLTNTTNTISKGLDTATNSISKGLDTINTGLDKFDSTITQGMDKIEKGVESVTGAVTDKLGPLGDKLGTLGDKLGGFADKLGFGGGSSSFSLNTILGFLNKRHNLRFGNDYLSATCSLDRFDLGNSGICDSATKVEEKVLSFLNKKMGMGVCSIGSGKASACGNKYVRNICNKVVDKAKNYPLNGKDSKIGETANSPLGSILRTVDKYLDVTVTRSTCDFDTSSSSGSTQNTSASGSSNSSNGNGN